MSFHSQSRPARRRAGFTLVELLVVIGIIAVLIGILLPSLNKARQQASMLACKANLRSIGQALAIYEGDNKGVMPYGFWDGTWDPKLNNGKGGTDSGATASNGQGDWTMLLTATLTPKAASNSGDNYKYVTSGVRKMFLCPDAPPGGDKAYVQGGANTTAISQYACHPRLMPSLDSYWGANAPDPITGKALQPYNVSRIRNASDIIDVYDAALVQVTASGGSSWGCSGNDPTGILLDNYAVQYGGAGQTYKGDTGLTTAYGTLDNNDENGGQPVSVISNQDIPSNSTDVRFRHMSNTKANALFVDGHVSDFTLSGHPTQYFAGTTDLLRKNVNVTP